MTSPELIAALTDFLEAEMLLRAGRFALTLIIGLPLTYLLSRGAERLLTRRGSAESGMITSKAVFYLGMTLITLTCLRELGWDLTAFLGAAGIFGVAIGFASQTSLSNIISGLFLVWEKPFSIGDAIDLNGTTGVIQSIGLLSVKLRTYDNRFIRIPNETLIKSNVINISRFPNRRCDLQFNISHKADPERVMEILREAAENNPYCLKDPAPAVYLTGFAESSQTFFFGPWCKRPEYVALRNTILTDVKVRFEAEGIRLAVPQRALQADPDGRPFSIRIDEDHSKNRAGLPDAG